MNAPTSYEADKSLQFYIGLGGGYNNYKNLNASFENADLPAVGKYALLTTLEANIRNKNLLIGLTGNMGASFRKPDHFNVLLNFNPQVNVGYYIVNDKKFHFAPQVGIGAYSSSVNIEQKDNAGDFNDVLANGNAISINQNVAALDFCLRFDFADYTKPQTGATSIKLGYKHGLSKRGWGIDATSNSTINNSPEDRVSQFYLQFLVGVALQKPKH
ncbi:MAG: hypothetical protein JO072_05175 [Parafilimonas sp.]|nr:hypothetical protein [Parafilimonas sp.]